MNKKDKAKAYAKPCIHRGGRRTVIRRQRQTLRRLEGLLLFLSALIIMAGIARRMGAMGSMNVSALPSATEAPKAVAYQEKQETREITLEACTWYAIQTGIYSGEDAARQRAAAYAERGAPGVAVEDQGKWRVLIACYADQEDAASVRERLADKQEIETYLYTWTCPEVQLRMSGMTGQLDAAQSGLTLLVHTAEQLRDAALLLDAGEKDTEEMLTRILDLTHQLDVWTEEAQKRFSKPYPALIEKELAQAKSMSAALGEAKTLRKSDAATFSGFVKCRAMEAFDCAVRLRQSLI